MSNDPIAPLIDPSVPLDAILRTDELKRRPSRAPDFDTEVRALTALVSSLADSPSSILQTLAETTLEVLQAQSAGLSLLAGEGERFEWAAVAGAWTPHLGGGTPRSAGPCGDVLDRDEPLLFSHWELRYPYLRAATPLASEGLLTPFHLHGEAVGTIWVIAHDEQRRFEAEDLRMLQSLGRFAAAAYQAVQLQEAEAAKRAAEALTLSQQKLIDELNHRVKNTLATVQSIAAHTLERGSEGHRTFEARLVALSRTHDILCETKWEKASLAELLRNELEPFRSAAAAPFALQGPEVELWPKAALALGAAFHELATNAAKYGALSTPEGRIRVEWGLDPMDQQLILAWIERNGPIVKPPARRGFGTRVIEGLELELGADVRVSLEPAGLTCAIKMPFGGRS